MTDLFEPAESPAEESSESWWNPDALASPIAWYGGKKYYAKWIIGQFCDHRVFVEPFAGAANILLRKRKSEVEIYNDLDNRVTNFFSVLRSKESCNELIRLASLTPYSREQFSDLASLPEPSDPIEKAWWFFVRCRQSMGGLGMASLTPRSWSSSTRTRRGMPEGVSKYLSSIDGLNSICERLREVMFESLPALEVIERYDSNDVLLYVDPPYLPETRHGGKASTYGKEMTFEEHEQLLLRLNTCKAKVVLSGYESSLYNETLGEWRREEKVGKSHVSNSGQSRIEILWMNY